MLKKFMAALLAVCLLLTTLPTAMLAGEGDGIGGETKDLTVTIESLRVADTVYQGDQYGVVFDFKIDTTAGVSLEKGDVVSVETNIGELFDGKWDEISPIEIYADKERTKVLASVDVTADKITITVGEVETNTFEIQAPVTIPGTLVARNVGAENGKNVEKTLEIGERSKDVTFKWKDSGSSGGSNYSSVDIDTLWKSAYELGDLSGATITIEVNPIGSMDLYGYSTNTDPNRRTPVIHDTLFVSDEIPEHGFVDVDSVKICTAVSSVGTTTEEHTFNTWYTVPAGTNFANRWCLRTDIVDSHMTLLKQNEGESRADFEQRLKATSLSWGIYYDEESNTETFMCNFGRVGDKNNNNGLMFKDFADASWIEEYPDIFGPDAFSGGNVMSYYIEFVTYYPDIVGTKEVRNYGKRTSFENGSNNPSTSGNYSAYYTIDNTTGVGVARKNEVRLKLVDKDDSTPIAGAKFKVQQLQDEQWVDVPNLETTTDENGLITFAPFPKGEYRLVQVTYTDGYLENSTIFAGNGESAANSVESDGTFTVSGTESVGFATIVTNKKAGDPVKVTFDKNDQSEPNVIKEVTLEKDSAVGNAWPTNPSRDGYTFIGWNTEANGSGEVFEATTLVSEDITVYAQWQPVEFVTLTPEDQTIYTGGVNGSDENDEFPHPIYLLGGEALDENTLFCVNGTVWNNETYEYPFTVKYYDDSGTEITDDRRYGDYTARIVPVKGVKLSDITTADGKGIDFQEGTLRIRYVSSFTEASDNALTSDAVLYTDESGEATARAQVEASGEAGVILPASSQIYLNGNHSYVYSADGPGQIALLFDELLPASAGGNSTDLVDDLIDRAAEEGYNIQDSNTMFRYLDLVDTKDSNAWVSSSEGSDVFWPYPEGCDRNDDIQLLHFTDLHREYRMDNDTSLTDLIADSEVENVTIEKTANGIWFYVDESGFSPFALVWDEKNDHPHWPPVGPGDDDDDPSENPEEPDTPDDLNTVDHFSYVVGYPEDYRTGEPTDNEDLWPVKPQSDITRAEVATIFYRLLKADVRDENTTDVSDFSDVSSSDWYGTTVATLAEMNIVEGYEDGTFRPNAPITRAEFAAIATRFFEKTGATYEPGTFTDVTGDEWFASAIMDAVNLGLIGGYEDGTVRPNNNITRAEACAIVNRTLGRVPDADHLLPADEMKTWPDNPETAWYYADMQEATNGHEYEWITDDGSRVEEWTGPLDKDWTSRSAN